MIDFFFKEKIEILFCHEIKNRIYLFKIVCLTIEIRNEINT